MQQAAQAAFFVPPQRQRRAAMHAELIEHADLAVGVAKHHQVFTKKLGAQRRTVRLRHLM